MNLYDLYKLSSLISSKLGITIPLPKSLHPDTQDPSSQPIEMHLASSEQGKKTETQPDTNDSAPSAAPFSSDEGAYPVPDTSQKTVSPEEQVLPALPDVATSTENLNADFFNNDFLPEINFPNQETSQPTLAAEPYNGMDDKRKNLDPASDEDLIMEYDHDHLPVANYTEDQLLKSKQKLTELMRTCQGVYGALIHTVDGHDLLSVLSRDLPSSKISTMTSSFLALGETIARESSQKFCQYAMLENSNGRMISLRINEILMLTCISTKDSNPGLLLSAGRRTADLIAKILVYPA